MSIGFDDMEININPLIPCCVDLEGLEAFGGVGGECTVDLAVGEFEDL